MIEELRKIEDKFYFEIEQLKSQSALAALKADYLGKKGILGRLLRGLSQLEPTERQRFGQAANSLKQKFNHSLQEKQKYISELEIEAELERNWLDYTNKESLYYRSLPAGSYHPVSILQKRLEDTFISMGFTVLDGPHIEDSYHNFTALNVPEDHPARDMQDTFWFRDGKHLLRTHTSAVQVHGMKKYQPPFRFVAPGKVFRCEAIDASHEAVFHQMEGMMVDEGISVAHLLHFMKTLLSELIVQDVEVRLRPGYFPFVEPGFELDIRCLICEGKGCSVCKKSGWVELLPCGMIHPKVLEEGNIDTKKFSGFAFGLGLDRLVMMRYKIDDIRHIHSGNLLFLRQFAGIYP